MPVDETEFLTLKDARSAQRSSARSWLAGVALLFALDAGLACGAAAVWAGYAAEAAPAEERHCLVTAAELRREEGPMSLPGAALPVVHVRLDGADLVAYRFRGAGPSAFRGADADLAAAHFLARGLYVRNQTVSCFQFRDDNTTVKLCQDIPNRTSDVVAFAVLCTGVAVTTVALLAALAPFFPSRATRTNADNLRYS